jgi:hypothetical protein
MKNSISIAFVLVLAASGNASAGGTEGSIGVGAECALNGEACGMSINYDAGKFHFGGFFGFFEGGDDDDSDYAVGARFYYHLHSTAMSDFGLGGGFSVRSNDDRGMPMAERETNIYFEPAIQIRLFLASNVALSFTAGIVIGLGDAQDGYGISLGAQNVGSNNGQAAVTATGGVHYYF